jgi:hypothetical protein
MTTEVWLRADPPALSRRTPSLAGSHHLADPNGTQITNDTWSYVMVMDQPYPLTVFSTSRAGLAPEEAANACEIGSDCQPTAWERSDFEEGGLLLARYEWRSIRNNFEVEELIIADAGSRRIVRKVERQYELHGHQLVSETISDQYSYNQPAPEGTFEMPPGKPRQVQDMQEFRAQHMPDVSDEATKAALRSILNECDVAWKGGDWAAFANLWQFSVYPWLPTEDDWRREFDQHAPNWDEWQSTANEMHFSDIIAIPMSANSFQMRKVADRVIQVQTSLRAARESGDRWEGRCEYYLQALEGGYRLVHANIPLDEIEMRQTRQ